MRKKCILLLLLFFVYVPSANALVFYRITGISDITITGWSIGDPGISTYIDVCVHTTVLGPYAITVSSSGGYNLTNGSNNIPYTLTWEDSGAGSLGSNGGAQLTNNVALLNRQNANSSLFSNDCSTGSPAGPTARLRFSITQAAMISAIAGIYNGSILLTVGPV